MPNHQPIGIFDSGVGGTSIFKEIHRLLPMEKTVYLADSKHAPYGVRSREEIMTLCIKNTELLLSMGCKIIVVACNTATVNAIKELRESYDVPFIGIEPAIKPAALKSSKKCIGILATRGTLSSQLFAETSDLFAKDTEVIEVEGEGLVQAIESGKENEPESLALIEQLLQPILTREIDYLVLGCSHYPYLIPQFKKLLPEHVKIIDSGKAVARQTQTVLQTSGLLAGSQQGTPIFYTNKNPRILEKFVGGKGFKISYLDF